MENNAKYFINFKDGQRVFHELEISHAFYQAFRKLENWDWRHREFNKVWEEILQRRALRLPKSLDELLLDAERDELLYRTTHFPKHSGGVSSSITNMIINFTRLGEWNIVPLLR